MIASEVPGGSESQSQDPHPCKNRKDGAPATCHTLQAIDDIEGGRCLPVIGAGFSLNAKLPAGQEMPAWAGLTRRMEEIAKIPPGLGGPAVASKFEKLFDRVQLIEAIRKALHADHAEPGDAHLAFAALPFDTIYTTNFDQLLEDASQRQRKPFRSIAGESQMPFHGDRLTSSIIKMHGDLRHEEHVIVTAEDYARYLDEYLRPSKPHSVKIALTKRAV